MALVTEAVRDESGLGATVNFEFEETGVKRSYRLDPEHPLYQEFALSGLEKKIRDLCAHVSDQGEKVRLLDAQLDAFTKGQWSLRGEGATKAGLLVQAVAQIFNVDVEQAQEHVDAMSRKDQATLRGDPRVASVIAELKAAKQKKDVGGDLLKQLSSALAPQPQDSTPVADVAEA